MKQDNKQEVLNSSPVSAGVVDERAAVCWVNDQQLLLCSKSPREDAPNNPMLHGQPRNIAGSSLRTDYCNTPLYARAALSAPSHGEQVRDGWKLVPVEPTEAMLREALSYDSIQDPNNPDSRVEELLIDWSLMLAGAPSAVSQEQGE